MKKSTIILVWGGATAIALVIYYQALKFAGMENSGLRWISVLLMFSGILFGTLQLRKKVNGGYLTYGQGFSAGFFMVLIITVVAVIATSIDIQLHPDYMDKMLEQSRINMINKGYTDQQIEMSNALCPKVLHPPDG